MESVLIKGGGGVGVKGPKSMSLKLVLKSWHLWVVLRPVVVGLACRTSQLGVGILGCSRGHNLRACTCVW